jgi:hypothetical protein
VSSCGHSSGACNDSAPTPAGPTVNFYENPTKTWRLNWTLIDDGDCTHFSFFLPFPLETHTASAPAIEFNVSARTTSWWALGINNNENMVGADIMWCSFNGLARLPSRRHSSLH